MIVAFFGISAFADETKIVQKKELKEKELWGREDHGLRIGLHLRQPNIHEFHPGEFLKWIVVVQNVSGADMHIPQAAGETAEFHIVTPSGKELVYDPMGFGLRKTKAFDYKIVHVWKRSVKGWSTSVVPLNYGCA